MWLNPVFVVNHVPSQNLFSLGITLICAYYKKNNKDRTLRSTITCIVSLSRALGRRNVIHVDNAW